MKTYLVIFISWLLAFGLYSTDVIVHPAFFWALGVWTGLISTGKV